AAGRFDAPVPIRWYHKEGRLVWTEQYLHPRYDEQGRLIRIVGVARDITLRRKAEEKAHLHSQILSSLTEGVYLIRAADGIIVFANPAFEAMFGYGPGEMTGLHVSAVNAPTDRSPEEIARIVIDEIHRVGVWKGEILNRRKNGASFWCRASVRVIDHPEYGPVWLSMHEDITERRRAEEESRQAHELGIVVMLLRGIADHPG
ncbi:MAG: PAS domain S-box protein, partial [Nitrospinae bacterium]|nr:PAS domain S-box protein [Nitrospinota bacterium]